MRARRAVDVVEAGYSLEGTDQEWLSHVLSVAHPDLEYGSGTYAFTARIQGETMVPDGNFAACDLDRDLFSVVEALNRDLPPEIVRSYARRASSSGTVRSFFGHGPGLTRLHELGQPARAVDGCAFLAQDGEGNALTFAGLSRRPVRYVPRISGIWRRVGLHIAAGWRLRRHLRKAEMLLTPDGKVVDATTEARDDVDLRARIVAGARAVDRARTRALRADPAAALDLWQGLVAGRWSLVDHWESDGRRFVAAMRNEPAVADPRSLSPQERAVVRYAWLAASNKEIAYVLGLPVDSVAAALASALRKLGCRRRSDLVALGDPAEWHTTQLAVGGDVVRLASTDARPRGAELERLTPAERAVAELVITGDTNAAIAKKRRSSVHTVVNQLRAIYSKLGVASRAELVRALVRSRRPGDR